MKILTLAVLTASAFLPGFANAQGTLLFDQQSADESNPGSGGNLIQSQPMGQSFTPSLGAISFVRLSLYDHIRDNGIGATIYVNLRSDSITGAIIDSTAPVTLPDNLSPGSFVDFFFPINESLTPGVKYYLQPVVQTGDEWIMMSGVFNYAGGEGYNGGVVMPTAEYWFREGVVVPEPSTGVLLVVGGALWLAKRKR